MKNKFIIITIAVLIACWFFTWWILPVYVVMVFVWSMVQMNKGVNDADEEQYGKPNKESHSIKPNNDLYHDDVLW